MIVLQRALSNQLQDTMPLTGEVGVGRVMWCCVALLRFSFKELRFVAFVAEVPEKGGAVIPEY